MMLYFLCPKKGLVGSRVVSERKPSLMASHPAPGWEWTMLNIRERCSSQLFEHVDMSWHCSNEGISSTYSSCLPYST